MKCPCCGFDLDRLSELIPIPEETAKDIDCIYCGGKPKFSHTDWTGKLNYHYNCADCGAIYVHRKDEEGYWEHEKPVCEGCGLEMELHSMYEDKTLAYQCPVCLDMKTYEPLNVKAKEE